jgi:hypothetical protein
MKQHEGEDLYGTFVPAQSVEYVLRVAPTRCFLRLTPAVACWSSPHHAVHKQVTKLPNATYVARVIITLDYNPSEVLR